MTKKFRQKTVYVTTLKECKEAKAAGHKVLFRSKFQHNRKYRRFNYLPGTLGARAGLRSFYAANRLERKLAKENLPTGEGW